MKKFLFVIFSFCGVFNSSVAFSSNTNSARELCGMDIPQPVLKNGSYNYDKGLDKAFERMQLDANITLYLEHTTCEYNSLQYSFVLKDPVEDGKEYEKAIELLTLLEKKSTEKINFSNEKRALNAYSKVVVMPKLKEDLYSWMSEAGFSEKVSIDIGNDLNPRKLLIIKTQAGPY